MKPWRQALRLLWNLWRHRRALVVRRDGGLGDVLSLLPVLAQYRQRQQRPVVLLTAAAWVPLLSCCGAVDAVLAVSNRGGWLWRRWPGLLSWRFADEQTPPSHRPEEPLGQGLARQLAEPFEGLSAWRQWRLEAALVEQTLQRVGPGPWALLHPGPTWAVKHWPASHWQQTVEALKRTFGLRVLQVGASRDGEGNAPRMPAIEGAEDWVDALSLPELLALMGRASLFVGVDSGLLHLAACADAPRIGLFGPTSPRLYQEAARLRCCTASLSCQPCHHAAQGPQHWRSGCPQAMACMPALQPEAVLAAARDLLHSAQAA
jgi:ADP-heptose:LPS heptosyltransferase